MTEIALYKKDEDKLLIKQVIQAAVADRTSEEINNNIAYLKEDFTDNIERMEDFCNRFDLGNWFLDAMTLNDIDIIEELEGIFLRKFNDEIEEREEDRLFRMSIQRENA